MKNLKDDFLRKAKLIHGEKYDYSLVEYINNKIKIKIICRLHGEFTQIPKNHTVLKQGCSKCAGVNISNTGDFTEKSIKIHGDKYNYSLVEYINRKTKVKIICKEHGEFKQEPSNHLQGQNCPFCAKEILNNKPSIFTVEYFINKAKITHAGIYDYSLIKDIKINKKVEIICKKHGIFKQNPYNHISGQNCPKCKMSKGVEKICRVLEKNNIEHLTEQSIEGCRSPKNRLLHFDILIPNLNTYIEYDGEQHFREVSIWGGEKAFEEGKVRDKIKDDFCLKNNIKLLRISYTDDIEAKLKEIIN